MARVPAAHAVVFVAAVVFVITVAFVMGVTFMIAVMAVVFTMTVMALMAVAMGMPVPVTAERADGTVVSFGVAASRWNMAWSRRSPRCPPWASRRIWRAARKGGKEFGMAHGGLSWSVFRYI